jgi:formiminoglutamase
VSGIPNSIAAEWPELRPGRLAAVLRRGSSEGCRCALLGLPDDLGVQLNGGRTGAREGPRAFRAALARFGVPWDGLNQQSIDVGIFDAGDVEPAPGSDEAALLETHRRVEAAVRALQERGLVTVCIGGGHDLTLPSARAAAEVHGGGLGGVNFDAHLDVRARVGSGMAFRRLIEGGHLEGIASRRWGSGASSTTARISIGYFHAGPACASRRRISSKASIQNRY